MNDQAEFVEGVTLLSFAVGNLSTPALSFRRDSSIKSNSSQTRCIEALKRSASLNQLKARFQSSLHDSAADPTLPPSAQLPSLEGGEVPSCVVVFGPAGNGASDDSEEPVVPFGVSLVAFVVPVVAVEARVGAANEVIFVGDTGTLVEYPSDRNTMREAGPPIRTDSCSLSLPLSFSFSCAFSR